MSRLASLLPGPPPWILGVVNMTPDSFSDGGRFLEPEAALAEAEAQIAAGAHMIDIGGVSTAPGSGPIAPEEEWARIAPLVEALAPRHPVSVDTYRVSVAERALAAGAAMINDVSAARAEDGAMIDLLAEHDSALLALMFAKDGPLPHVTEEPRPFRDPPREVGDFLAQRVELCLRAGIAADRLVVDPGMGRFVSLEPEDSFCIVAEFERLTIRFRPMAVMIGASRKGFLGGAAGAERAALGSFLALQAAAKGAQLLRSHDVGLLAQMLRLARAVKVVT